MAVLPDVNVPEAHRRYAPGRGHVAQPVRQSLPVDELAELLAPNRIEPGRLGDAIGHLETQLRLRELDAHHYAEWERTVRSIGTADALAEVAQVRTGFIDVISSSTASRRTAVEAPQTWNLQFSGNLPAVAPAAGTPRGRAAAELDTRPIEAIELGASTHLHIVTEIGDRRVGDTGWKARDVVYGDGAALSTPARRFSIVAIATAVSTIMGRVFDARRRHQGAR